MLTIELRILNKCWAHKKNLFQTHDAFLVSVHRSSPNHTPVKYRCLIEKSNRIMPAYQKWFWKFKDILVLSAYSGPSDPSVGLGNFEAFVKVPTFLRPHTQIFCTRWVAKISEHLLNRLVNVVVYLECWWNPSDWQVEVCGSRSEWVLQGREDLVKEITNEIQFDNNEVCKWNLGHSYVWLLIVQLMM